MPQRTEISQGTEYEELPGVFIQVINNDKTFFFLISCRVMRRK